MIFDYLKLIALFCYIVGFELLSLFLLVFFSKRTKHHYYEGNLIRMIICAFLALSFVAPVLSAMLWLITFIIQIF